LRRQSAVFGAVFVDEGDAGHVARIGIVLALNHETREARFVGEDDSHLAVLLHDVHSLDVNDLEPRPLRLVLERGEREDDQKRGGGEHVNLE